MVKNRARDSMTNPDTAATRVAEYETVVPPTDNTIGGVEFKGNPWDYGIGLDITHDQVSAENPLVWAQDDGNIG